MPQILGILKQGFDAISQQPFLHAIVQDVETESRAILTHVNGKTFIHKILASGEMESTALNLPLFREVLELIDGLIPPA